MSDTDGLDEGNPAVTLMTCHSAKGLEFAHVFLIGFEEGLLPHAISMDEDSGIEEERRLCYVAMTRACKSLMLTAAESRMLYGEWKQREISRFYYEIPSDSVQVDTRRTEKAPKPKAMPKGMAEVDDAALKLGTRVRHAKFGRGTCLC